MWGIGVGHTILQRLHKGVRMEGGARELLPTPPPHPLAQYKPKKRGWLGKLSLEHKTGKSETTEGATLTDEHQF